MTLTNGKLRVPQDGRYYLYSQVSSLLQLFNPNVENTNQQEGFLFFSNRVICFNNIFNYIFNLSLIKRFKTAQTERKNPQNK